MKIILLRHEERENNFGFYSNLTENGIIKSCDLPKKFKKLNIDLIFSSPFIRTLQTIFLYAEENNKKVNIEYGLYEYLHNPYFLLGNWYYSINDINDNSLLSIVNNNYSSIINKDDFIVLENEFNLSKRIKKFFNNLMYNYNNKTILIVSHKAVINKIKDLFVKKTNLDDNFDMGHYEIYDI
jgi:broad specificity phosphatase PhoE